MPFNWTINILQWAHKLSENVYQSKSRLSHVPTRRKPVKSFVEGTAPDVRLMYIHGNRPILDTAPDVRLMHIHGNRSILDRTNLIHTYVQKVQMIA